MIFQSQKYIVSGYEANYGGYFGAVNPFSYFCVMERNSYLISHAFRNYLWASLLSSVCMQLTVMADAMVAGHFIGPDALAAINLAMPLITMVTALITLIGLGPAIMAAKAIGSRNMSQVNSIFSSTIIQVLIIGVLQALLLSVLMPYIANWLCPNDHLLPYLSEYIAVLPYTFIFQILVITLVSLIEADGKPQLAAKGVVVGSLINVVLDYILVKFAGAGIQGIALAMLANYVSVTIYFIFLIRRDGVSYQWVLPSKNSGGFSFKGIKEGWPMMINDLLYSLMTFVVNTLLLTFCGETELYFWAVFLQLLILVLVIVDCAEGAILSIGSVLEGEDDRFGLQALVSRLFLLVGGLVLLIVVTIWIFPDYIAMLFADGDDISENWPYAARILSLMLIPYSLSAIIRIVSHVLGKRMRGVFFSLLQFVLISVLLYGFIQSNPEHLWWTFPISSSTILILQLLYSWILHKRSGTSSSYNIVPMSTKKDFLDISVKYEEGDVVKAIQHVCKFLEEHDVEPLVEMEINICCEELMLNIVRYQTYKTRSYMDLSVMLKKDNVLISLKDSGRPFNPVLSFRSHEMLKDDKSIGLYLVNSVCTRLTHSYMYGLNVVFAEFKR